MARPKKSEPAKTPASAAVEAVKETVTAKKAAVKKAAAKKVEEVYLQIGSSEWNVSECKARAVAAYVEKGHRASSVKKLVVYLKPEEGKAYYVVNDGESGSFDL